MLRQLFGLFGSAALVLALPYSALASPFYAPPPPGEDADAFSADIEFGFTRLSGNTDSRTLLSKGRLTWLTGNWTHSLRGEVRHVARDGDTSAEQYLGAWRERYDLDGDHYLFGFARWEKDRFSGYNQQVMTTAGYGRQVLDGDVHRLSLEAGPGYRFDDVRDGENEGLGVAYGAIAYDWELSSTAAFSQELSVESTSDNTTTRSYSALTARLNSRMSLRLSHEIRHNSEPPETATSRRDMTTSASLVYSW